MNASWHKKGNKRGVGNVSPSSDRQERRTGADYHYFVMYIIGSLIFLAASLVFGAVENILPKLGPQHPLSERVAYLTINEEYETALALIDSLLERQPQHPFGWLMRATVLTARSIDYEDDVDMLALLEACEKTEALCQGEDSRLCTRAEAELYRGMAEMYLVMIDHRQGRLYAAIKRLFTAGEHLKRAAAADPELWDVYYGLGMYQYYLSRGAGIIRSLGIIPDRRDEGLAHIRLGAEKGSITHYAALNSLAWIQLENGNYRKAIEEVKPLLERFPQRRAFLWTLSKSYIKSKKWKEAVPALEQLRIAVGRQKRNNHYNEVSCLKMLAEAHFHLGHWQLVCRLADEAAGYQLSDWVLQKKKGDLKVLRDLKAQSMKKMKEE